VIECPDRGCVVLSENGRTKWSFESKTFGYEVKKLVNVRDRNQTLLEESIAIYSLGMVLTLIYTEDLEELEDNEDNEDNE
jgi:hypothetical protein